MSKKRVARSKQSDQSSPSLVQWDIFDLLSRAKKHCNPIHRATIEALPSDFLAHFVSAIVLGFEDITARRETLTQMEQVARWRQQAREQAQQNLESSLSLMKDQLNAQGCIISEDYREELIQEQLCGSPIEIQSLLEAANLGVSRFFLASRKLPGYAEAKESVRRHIEKEKLEFNQRLTSIQERAENGERFGDREINALHKEFQRRRANQQRRLTHARQYRKEFFGETQPAMILAYWLPFSLWCFDTSDCVRILCEHSPGARFINNPLIRQQLIDHEINQATDSPPLITSNDLETLQASSAIYSSDGAKVRLTKESFRVHVSRLELFQHKPAHWSLESMPVPE
ncbi:MAG: hypothetical protein JNM99_01370 [Verrucomicrobiaceae bacterium]|nr:hypothetical protein [Verrucomicrobiaceae bacterium]